MGATRAKKEQSELATWRQQQKLWRRGQGVRAPRSEAVWWRALRRGAWGSEVGVVRHGAVWY